MKFSVLAILSAPLLVSAQGYGGGDPASSGSSAAPSSSAAAAAPLPTAGPNERIVAVGQNGDLTFTPSSITAPNGTLVRFIFVQPPGFLHAVAQSTFSAPCSALANGFNSGLQGPGMEFNLTITNETQPIWLLCTNESPLKHCGMGMVGGINVPTNGSNTLDAFRAAASSIGNNEAPQTATAAALSGIGAAATAPAASRAAAGAAASSGSNGAEKLVVGAGSLMATLLAFVALA